MANLGKVMYLTQAQYATLQSTGTITVDGVTYTYSDNDLYLVPSEDIVVDNTPTSGSDNPVSSGGVYTALSGKQNTLTFDNTPTQNSTNPVSSGGVYTALQGKQNALTFDNTPTQNSTNPVTSGGVYAALQNVSAPSPFVYIPLPTLTYSGGSYSINNNASQAYTFVPRNVFAKWEDSVHISPIIYDDWNGLGKYDFAIDIYNGKVVGMHGMYGEWHLMRRRFEYGDPGTFYAWEEVLSTDFVYSAVDDNGDRYSEATATSSSYQYAVYWYQGEM